MSEHTPYEEYVRSFCDLLFNLTEQTECRPRAASTRGDTCAGPRRAAAGRPALPGGQATRWRQSAADVNPGGGSCAHPRGGGVWAGAPRGSVSADVLKSGAQIQRK